MASARGKDKFVRTASASVDSRTGAPTQTTQAIQATHYILNLPPEPSTHKWILRLGCQAQ